jgi:hypothetical protein
VVWHAWQSQPIDVAPGSKLRFQLLTSSIHGFASTQGSAIPEQSSSTALPQISSAPGLIAALVSSQSLLFITYPAGAEQPPVRGAVALP